MDTKIIANYLPQYHEIPENNKWWGQGFTDWIAVRDAKKLYDGHNQPRVPLNDNYYSLDQVEAIKWQTELAKRYGIDGFAIYHYWFSSEQMLLQKPAEIILENADIDIDYLFLWDNFSWRRTWSKFKNGNDWAPKFDSQNIKETDDSEILAVLKYGDISDWEKHFYYLLNFFKDKRYVKIDNKPVFGFFQSRNDFETLVKMTACWDELAKKSGFAGMNCIFNGSLIDDFFPNISKCGQYYRFKYTPIRANRLFDLVTNRVKDTFSARYEKLRFYNYDSLWRGILSNAKRSNEKVIALSGFVDFDDTPRRGERGRIVKGATPAKFEKYFCKLLRTAMDKNKAFVFLTAWNEWGEGAYLEPDTKNGYAYLQAVKNAVDAVRGGKHKLVILSLDNAISSDSYDAAAYGKAVA